MKIYVGNLAPETTETDLQKRFGCFGRVASAVLARDELSGQSKGCGCIDMPVDAEAWNAIRRLDGQGLQVQGWVITPEAAFEAVRQAELNLDKPRFKTHCSH